jgi:hypothetical protein
MKKLHSVVTSTMRGSGARCPKWCVLQTNAGMKSYSTKGWPHANKNHAGLHDSGCRVLMIEYRLVNHASGSNIYIDLN